MRRLLALGLGVAVLVGCAAPTVRPVELSLGVQSETQTAAQSLANAYQNRATNSRITLVNAANETDATLLLLPDTGSNAAFQVAVGLDALVMIVHEANPVRDITQSALLRLLRGDEATWEALGGSGLDVVSVQLPAESPTRRALDSREGVRIASDTRLVGSVGQAVDVVSRTEGAFSVVTLGSLPTFEGIQVVRINGYAPTEEHILSRQYPYVFPLVYAAAAEPEGDSLTFLEWVLSAEGQQALRDTATPVQGQ